MNRNAVYVRVLLVLIALVILLAFMARSPRHAPVDPWLPSSFNPVGAAGFALAGGAVARAAQPSFRRGRRQ
jgi:hypothetical protein